jgi:hypothetical protein
VCERKAPEDGVVKRRNMQSVNIEKVWCKRVGNVFVQQHICLNYLSL